jgi:hypothetical protein
MPVKKFSTMSIAKSAVRTHSTTPFASRSKPTCNGVAMA